MVQLSKKTALSDSSKKFSSLEILQGIVLLCVLLYFGKTLFIPLSFSLLISFLLYPVCEWMEKKGISKNLAILISISLVSFFIVAILYLLFAQIMAFTNEWQTIKTKLYEAINQLSLFIYERFGFTSERQLAFLNNSFGNSGSQAMDLVKSTIYSLAESVISLLMIPVFSVLILFHRKMLAQALYHIFPSEKRKIIREILIETIHEYYNFIKGMLLVYLIVGLLNSIGLALIGIPHPFLFGFIAAVLTFIPYIGIMISSLLPIAISWITFNSVWYPLGVVIVFSVVQLLEAYIIFPIAVGRRLKINTLVILITIIIGGILWGAAGMILFIPFVSILKLIADRTESLKTLSLLLGDGKSKKD